MICDTFYKEAEFAYKIKDVIHGDYDGDVVEDYDYLSQKLKEFCVKTNIAPMKVYKKSRTPRIVMYKVAFMQFLPDNYSSSKIGNFLNYDHSTVIHWRKLHSEYYLNYNEYRELIRKINQ